MSKTKLINTYKIIIIIIFTHLSNFAISQIEKESKIIFNSGISKASIELNTKLSDKLYLDNALIFSYNYQYNLIEIPINLRYKLNEKLDLFVGTKLNYFKSNNSLFGSNLQEYNFSIQAGIKYNFSQNAFGGMKYEYNITKNNITNFSTFKKGALKFNFGYNF